MTTGRSEDYRTGSLLGYDYYLKNLNIVGIDLSQQAVLDSDPEINQQIEFVCKLQSGNAAINYDLLTVLEREKQTVLKFSEGNVNLKLLSQQIKKLKEEVKSNNGTTLRIGNKNFIIADLLHELFLTQTQINKLREKVENNKSTDIKLSKERIKN